MNKLKLMLCLVLMAPLAFAQSSDADSLKRHLDGKQSNMVLISAADLENDEESADISGILQSSKDIFVSTSAYTFSATRFRMRGYGSENATVMMNGVNLNDMESGRVYWSSWGGLNDALRNTNILNGITASDFSFGGVGGATNMQVRASSYSPAVKFTYSLSNRSYTNRAMFTYATGLKQNGWAFAFSGSKRWAIESYVPGTDYDAYAYFASVEKRFNARHSVGLVAYGAPNKRSGSTASVQESYDLAGTNFYNPNWGYQNGKVRNARVSNYHKPMVMLSHYWTPEEGTNLTTSASYMFGRGGSTALSWFYGNDPRPDYYKNLPSYYAESNPAYAAILADRWRNDESIRQLDWDRFYNANRDEWAVIENADGINGNTVSGLRSNYIVEERRSDSKKLNLTSTFNKQMNEDMRLSAGMELTKYQGNRYTVLDDLLGGDFYLDINKFAERDFADPDVAQNDLNHPNRIVKVGDRFGYDYTANIDKYMLWSQMAFEYHNWDAYLGVNMSFDQFWRTGHMRNGLFPNSSYGDSEKHSFFDYGVKGGATYKLSGRQYLGVNAMYQTRPPQFRDAYLSDRTRHQVVDNLTNEKVLGTDFNYVVRFPRFKARLSAYYTQFDDKTWSRSFYHENFKQFVNFNLSGMKQTHMGMELGTQTELTPGLNFNMVAALGDYLYANNPQNTITVDNSKEVLSKETVYIKNYHIGGMPQTALSAGLQYRTPFFMFLGFDVNYFDGRYLPINPDRRTMNAVAGMSEDYPAFSAIIEQEKLPSAFTLNANIGKSWRIDYKYYINLNLSVNNILNTKDVATGGYEQYRYSSTDINKFANKYYYMYGTTYFLNLSFRF